jgi:hypothetical protein
VAKSLAQKRAEQCLKDANSVLRAAGLAPRLQVALDEDKALGLAYWSCFSSDPPLIDVPLGLPGRWFLKLSWSFWSDPTDSKQVEMFQSSISLNVESALTDGLGTKCLVRYDVDRRDTRRTGDFGVAHLNVLQPGAIEDKAHYPLPGATVDEWPLADVLRFFRSDVLRDDLDGLLPP